MIAFSNRTVGRFFFNLGHHLCTQLSLSNMCSILDLLHLSALIIGFNFSGNLKAVNMVIILMPLVQKCLIVDQLIKKAV